jgi:hypothetical protein
LVYGSDPFTAFRPARGLVNPATMPNILSSPFRSDGTALPCGYELPTDLTAQVVLYTEGNNWPVLGAKQVYPDPYLYPSQPWPYYAGICFLNNKTLPMSSCGDSVPLELTTPGLDIVKVVNSVPNVGVLIAGGSMPGSEQPGQVMTTVNPGESKSFPVPPIGWYNFLQPEMYISVAGLDPVDAVTWHHNSPTHPDLGTPGFAYIFNVMISSTGSMMVGFRKNEGYDVNLSPDPGYGLALYDSVTNALLAVQDLYLLPIGRAAGANGGSLQQDMWADPTQATTCYSAENEFLYAGFSLPGTTRLRLEIISHAAAQQLLAQQTGVVHCQFTSSSSCGQLCG